jgi:hypothetical protein
MPEKAHYILREGLIAGAIGATSVAIWFLIIDTIQGRPFFTPITLGRAAMSFFGPQAADEGPIFFVIWYTIFHYAAFFAVGCFAEMLCEIAEKEPSVLAGFLILFVAFEIGFHGVVALLQETTVLGTLAWYNIMIGNLIAALLMGYYLYRRHPELAEEFSHALDGTA